MSKMDEASKEELRLSYLFNDGLNLSNRVITLCPDNGKSDDSSRFELDMSYFPFFDAAMSELERINNKPITLRIFSEGGCIKTAMAIVGRHRSSSCEIITEGYGTIESAASLILASGDDRKMSRYGTFMWHEMNFGTNGRLSDIESQVTQAKVENKLWSKWMSEFSNKPPEFFVKNGKFVDVWWTPEQLLEFGLIDEII